MKVALLLISLILAANNLYCQSGPGGIGSSATNELWLQVDTNCFTDAGLTPGVNGSDIQQWNDLSGNARHAIQTTNANKPNLNTNALNGFSTLTFNGTSDRILSSGLTTSGQVTIFVVVQFNDLVNNNDGIIQASPTGTAFTTAAGDKSIGMWINTANGRIWGRGVQSNNTSRNITQTTTLSTGQFYIITQDFNGTDIVQYVNGTTAGSISYNNTLKSWSDFGIGRQGTESLDGDLAEIIVHRVSLNAAQKIITENYLAAKYGITLSSNDLYDKDNVGNGNFDFEVAGIGRTNASNIHSDAQGTGIVRILNPGGLGDDEFLIWGHNNGSPEGIELGDVPATVDARMDRVWRVSEVNAAGSAVDVGAVDIRFDLNGLGPVTASDLVLLVDSDNDGTFSDEALITGATSLGSGVFEFAGVTALTNNLRFTLGTSNNTQTPLPVELVSFNAEVLPNNEVFITWETATETNNDYFVVERSSDNVAWEPLTMVVGAGSTAKPHTYHTSDHQPMSGVSYYRLKQVDYDGSSSYSHVRSVETEMTKAYPTHIFPNPCTHEVTITGSTSDLKDLRILHVLGHEVTAVMRVVTSTPHTNTFDVSSLSPGIYYIQTPSSTEIFCKQ